MSQLLDLYISILNFDKDHLKIIFSALVEIKNYWYTNPINLLKFVNFGYNQKIVDSTTF